MNTNERNAAIKAATTQLDDICRTCGAESVVSYPAIGGLDVGYCAAHDPERDQWYWGTGFDHSGPGEWVGGREGPHASWDEADQAARAAGYDSEDARRHLVIRREVAQ